MDRHVGTRPAHLDSQGLARGEDLGSVPHRIQSVGQGQGMDLDTTRLTDVVGQDMSDAHGIESFRFSGKFFSGPAFRRKCSVLLKIVDSAIQVFSGLFRSVRVGFVRFCSILFEFGGIAGARGARRASRVRLGSAGWLIDGFSAEKSLQRVDVDGNPVFYGRSCDLGGQFCKIS